MHRLSYRSCAGRGEPALPRCWIFPRKRRATPFSSNVCLRALASRTLTFGTGSDARLRRLGSKCSTNWSTGMHSSSTTAYETNTQQEKARFMLKIYSLPFLSFLSTLSLIWPVKKSSEQEHPTLCLTILRFSQRCARKSRLISFRNVLGNAALFPAITLFPSNVQPLLLTATQVSIFGLEGVSGGNKEGNSS